VLPKSVSLLKKKEKKEKKAVTLRLRRVAVAWPMVEYNMRSWLLVESRLRANRSRAASE